MTLQRQSIATRVAIFEAGGAPQGKPKFRPLSWPRVGEPSGLSVKRCNSLSSRRAAHMDRLKIKSLGAGLCLAQLVAAHGASL